MPCIRPCFHSFVLTFIHIFVLIFIHSFTFTRTHATAHVNTPVHARVLTHTLLLGNRRRRLLSISLADHVLSRLVWTNHCIRIVFNIKRDSKMLILRNTDADFSFYPLTGFARFEGRAGQHISKD